MLRVGMMTEHITKFKNMKDTLTLIKELGYECADITLLTADNHPKLNSYFNGDKYLEKALSLKEHADKVKLPLVQAHAPFPVIKPGDNRYNKNMFNKLVKCIKICGTLKIKNLVIHPFNDYTDNENIEFFNKLIPYAKEENVVICTENMWRWNKEIQKARVCSCSLSDSFLNIIKGVNSPYLKACVDIGHAQMFNHIGLTPRKLIEEMNEYVYCLHIHDNDGIHDNHMAPFNGVIDFDDVIKGLKNINYQNDLILETRLPNEAKSLKDAKIFWLNQLESIKKIRDMIKE